MGDRYRHPGMPIITYNELGFPVLQSDKTGQLMYLLGEGGSVSGDRPFLDSFHLDTRRKNRLFRSQKPHFEHPVAFLNTDNLEMIIQRESRNEPPNYFRWNPGDKFHQQLTFNQNPFPELVKVQQKVLKYRRRDGLNLTANLYLPAGYNVKKDGPLPTLVWAYPKAYLNAGIAGQIKKSPYEFMEAKWNRPLLWVTRGYAIVDDPAMPILAEARGNPNDSFVRQLVESGDALVRELIKLGVSEPGKIGLGGHSYGAFMTANLLAHSDLFCAGIARSGAYNRTLTPFGFQSEERSLWEAMGVYLAMSPFLSANKINEPLLLLHGASDENAGTYPLQSERLFHAINGLGGHARLVKFPNEGHTLRGEDSIMHMLWEIEQWLDLQVRKQPQPYPWLLSQDDPGTVSSNASGGSGAEQEPE
jgi:dipeptidyl aminopeptidase/acylaminoacyl peptidase